MPVILKLSEWHPSVGISSPVLLLIAMFTFTGFTFARVSAYKNCYDQLKRHYSLYAQQFLHVFLPAPLIMGCHVLLRHIWFGVIYRFERAHPQKTSSSSVQVVRTVWRFLFKVLVVSSCIVPIATSVLPDDRDVRIGSKWNRSLDTCFGHILEFDNSPWGLFQNPSIFLTTLLCGRSIRRPLFSSRRPLLPKFSHPWFLSVFSLNSSNSYYVPFGLIHPIKLLHEGSSKEVSILLCSRLFYGIYGAPFLVKLNLFFVKRQTYSFGQCFRWAPWNKVFAVVSQTSDKSTHCCLVMKNQCPSDPKYLGAALLSQIA